MGDIFNNAHRNGKKYIGYSFQMVSVANAGLGSVVQCLLQSRFVLPVSIQVHLYLIGPLI